MKIKEMLFGRSSETTVANKPVVKAQTRVISGVVSRWGGYSTGSIDNGCTSDNEYVYMLEGDPRRYTFSANSRFSRNDRNEALALTKIGDRIRFTFVPRATDERYSDSYFENETIGYRELVPTDKGNVRA
ncbi:Uncharacterised protein [Burkholderia pseudomallei]|nr:Uncharacterised protein [Burkholderia pseudomallei]CAJ6710398.1 Uncharacterised protein [Burkholderia pseudomallei]